MNGVPDRTIMQLGGWQSEKMVKRHSYLSADYLRAAVERLASPGGIALHSDYTRTVDPAPDVGANY